MTAARIRFEGALIELRPSESVLDACLRSGIEVPFSCRGGVCQACLLRSVDGAVPDAAQRGLPQELVDRHYLLACQCRPSHDLALARPDARDRKTTCLLHEAAPSGDFLLLRFETARRIDCRPGQRLMLEDAHAGLVLEVTATMPDACVVEALLPREAGALPAWLQNAEFGHEFIVSGPLPGQPVSARDEVQAPTLDPALWRELDNGGVVRAVLEDFYHALYATPELASFFDGVTIERAIEKQYLFLRQLMSGEKVYFGDRPRNAHHWMVITEALFDQRQALMLRTLLAHGLDEGQIARWQRFEQHYRQDIVKQVAFPRRFGGADLPLEGYAEEVLSVGAVCDYCGAAVDAGTRVRYHVRLGQIGCPDCAAVDAPAEAPA
jgi:ferredoxin/truncated hemoglobin YjbI